MGSSMKWACCTAILLALLFALVHCVPVEVVYTGEACDCPKNLDYKINVPKVAKTKKYTPSEYGYKLDVPVPRKAHVTYSIDFTVEEPTTPKPVVEPKWELYAKVDRITMNRGDCESSPPTAAPAAPCSCGQCGITKPLYRYVYKKLQPCKCGRPSCNCNARTQCTNGISSRQLAPAASPSTMTTEFITVDTAPTHNHNIRRKRDLQRVFFRQRSQSNKRNQPKEQPQTYNDRPGRFVKLYHTRLPRKRYSLLPPALDHLIRPTRAASRPYQTQQPQTKKTQPNQRSKTKRRDCCGRSRSKIVKRDIKGEYDQLERDRDQLDLTLPEIIQFMPETLQPNFKRGACNIGCAACKMVTNNVAATSQTPTNAIQTASHEATSASVTSSEATSGGAQSGDIVLETINFETTGFEPNLTEIKDIETSSRYATSDKDRSSYATSEDVTSNISKIAATLEEQNTKAQHTLIDDEQTTKFTGNAIDDSLGKATFTKRNAGYFPYNQHEETSWYTEPAIVFREQTAPFPTPITLTPPPHAPYATPTAHPHWSPAPQNYYTPPTPSPPTSQRYLYDNFGHEYLDTDGQLHLLQSPAAVADPLDSAARPLQYAGDLESSGGYQAALMLGAPQPPAPHYAVQQISNAAFDRIISDIVYRHPDFIDATAHYGGALVDPEPWQVEQTKDFLQKLISGRLYKWFGDDDDKDKHHHHQQHNHYDNHHQQHHNQYQQQNYAHYNPYPQGGSSINHYSQPYRGAY